MSQRVETILAALGFAVQPPHDENDGVVAEPDNVLIVAGDELAGRRGRQAVLGPHGHERLGAALRRQPAREQYPRDEERDSPHRADLT